ncbi:hypothetical protein [Candidatus Nitrosocosmicus hydrocola]|uniref:hypothetical protein n=1 Tax=Candidatus Nitrosocosmicus hydrocola TaxID=1826872 RepID=UPI0011E5FA91|nr:hypothetical protein [Candidatus Nitrosocosmicus hydrocola]
MQDMQYMLVVALMAIAVIGLVANPSVSEQICLKNSNFESKNKGQQGEISDVKVGGMGASNDADINNRCYAVAA